MMNDSLRPPHRALKALLGTLAVVFGIVGLLVSALALLDGNRLRGPLSRYLSAHTGRDFRIDGAMEVHLLSLHPSLIAEHVSIGNPPWSPAGSLAEIGKLTVVFDLPWQSRPFAIRRLEMDDTSLHFRREEDGHANWLWTAPGLFPGKGMPVIHSLSIPAAHLEIHDERRHLMFAGSLTAGGADAAVPLKITATGELNGRQAILSIDGDPLATITREKPYRFTLDERSSGSHVNGEVFIAKPFDLRTLDGRFEAAGDDLKDLYFLLGVRLPDTATYRLSGKLERRNRVFRLLDLVATSGESDVRVALTSEMDDSGRSHLDIDLSSKQLRFADIGARAAGRAPAATADATPPEKSTFLPETPFKLAGLRKSDYVVNFHAQHLDTGKLAFQSVIGKMTIDHGTVTVPHVSAQLASMTVASAPTEHPLDGKLTATFKFDGKTDTPKASIDLRVTNIQLAQFARKDPSQPPLDGLLQAHVDLAGRGRSFHDIAAKSDGTVTLVLPQGAIRASLAELTGLDLRGLGLLLTRNKEATPIRCGVARFQAHDGTLTSQTMVVDTDPVLITGGGTIQLDSEALALEFQGHPKQLRVLRLSAPIAVQGTLRHPSIGLEKGHRKLELIDPGRVKDADCGTLLTEAKAGAE